VETHGRNRDCTSGNIEAGLTRSLVLIETLTGASSEMYLPVRQCGASINSTTGLRLQRLYVEGSLQEWTACRNERLDISDGVGPAPAGKRKRLTSRDALRFPRVCNNPRGLCSRWHTNSRTDRDSLWGPGYTDPLHGTVRRPTKRLIRNNTKKTTKQIFAIPAAAAAIPPKPSNAARIAITRNTHVYQSMFSISSCRTCTFPTTGINGLKVKERTFLQQVASANVEVLEGTRMRA
jgi:hypothetical protein